MLRQREEPWVASRRCHCTSTGCCWHLAGTRFIWVSTPSGTIGRSDQLWELHANNIVTPVLRNPVLFLLVIIMGGGLYVAYTLNLLGPMSQMANAAASQGVELGKAKLRDFIESNETAR